MVLKCEVRDQWKGSLRWNSTGWMS
jgi:hypothetical protein